MKWTKIIIGGIAGTAAMTLYSYIISKREKQQFTEPVLINKLINGSENLPEIHNTKQHPAGWVIHFATGIAFVIAYWFLWRRALKSPGIVRGLVIGSTSGILAIGAWKVMFAVNDNPPQNNRYGFYRQLFYAHLLFSIFALFGYKLPDYLNHGISRRRII